ncbi:hypothetical protein LOK49_LG01G01014 [Camellia lanceoleosa]|uniref:Uncharacterized protein n=1 Tax=Camellia lanceoleosa TaxID=1840588 RepID=A0ACC0IYF6_9ERIC|nr:hypothetical protein LOK49_LG01G01014 [Camellia lanceoleosa]
MLIFNGSKSSSSPERWLSAFTYYNTTEAYLTHSNEIALNTTQSNASESILFLSSFCVRDQRASIPLFRFDSVTK